MENPIIDSILSDISSEGAIPADLDANDIVVHHDGSNDVNYDPSSLYSMVAALDLMPILGKKCGTNRYPVKNVWKFWNTLRLLSLNFNVLFYASSIISMLELWLLPDSHSALVSDKNLFSLNQIKYDTFYRLLRQNFA